MYFRKCETAENRCHCRDSLQIQCLQGIYPDLSAKHSEIFWQKPWGHTKGTFKFSEYRTSFQLTNWIVWSDAVEYTSDRFSIILVSSSWIFYSECVSGKAEWLRVLFLCCGQHPGGECEYRPPGHQPRPQPPCGLHESCYDGPQPPEVTVMIVIRGHTNEEAGVTLVIHLARKLRAQERRMAWSIIRG